MVISKSRVVISKCQVVISKCQVVISKCHTDGLVAVYLKLA